VDVPIYFYDIETHDDLVYLHGVIRTEGDRWEMKSFFAGGPEEEKRAWHSFLDFISQDEEAVIYCWTTFEQSHAQECWKRHKGNRKGFALLERRLTDQCAFAKEHFAFPCRGYSIKDVAPLFGFKWQADDPGGMNCEAWFLEWCQTKDKGLYERIIQYNMDDVRAMEVIDRELRNLCGGKK
jgi:predicted RecB family nuclease